MRFLIPHQIKKVIFSAILISTVQLAYGGLIHIHKNSLSFNDQFSNEAFIAGERIIMRFRFDNYRYAGKPHQYIVFKLYEKNSSPRTDHDPKYFITKVNDKHDGVAILSLVKPNTEYTIRYHVLPYFDNSMLRPDQDFLEIQEINKIKKYYKDPSNVSSDEELITLSTHADSKELDLKEDLVLYFKNPRDILQKLEANKALIFQWYPGPESSKKITNIKYSYRIKQIEDWSIYSDQKTAEYFFLRPGDYNFEVKAKYLIDTVEGESSILTYKIFVENVIFQVKDEVGVQETKSVPPLFLKTNHYNTSRALLIGVADYDDPKFPKLPCVKNDVKLVERKLQALDFEVKTVTVSPNKDNIIRSLDLLLAEATENDRVILYFSGHGTSIGEAGFLVPSDGNSTSKTETCISFNDLRKWVDRLTKEKKIKHLLIVLDACQAGLGVYSKSANEIPVVEISKYKGAHMMTAGLLNQTALCEGTSSLFTRHFIKGINGLADYNKDGIVTLSELLVYVQNTVSELAMSLYEAEQTPMLGKIKGAGEMMFIVK